MVQRYLGGIITASPTEPSVNFRNGAASGVWTLDEQLSFSKAEDWPTAGRFAPMALFLEEKLIQAWLIL